MSLKIEMYDAQGALLDAPPEAYTYLHAGHGELLPALEDALEGHVAGDEVRLQLEPEQAFGDYDAALLRVEPIERYGDGLKVGMEVEEPDAAGESRIYTVTEIGAGKAVLDGNHPLAGMALRFSCVILSVRQATQEELSRGVSLP